MFKKILVIATFIITVFANNTLYSQYEVKSKYLLNPELNFGYVDSCAQFWLNSYDESNGGFFTNVNRTGDVNGSNKNMLTQSRDAYGMVRAFMLTGNESYLGKAKGALEFMYSTAWDNVYGGWFGQVDNNGTPFNVGDNKTAFNQHYALLGILAYYEATGDTTTWNWFEKGFLKNNNDLWDDDENLFGYYDNVTYNWYTKNGKSFNATVDAVTTHLLNAYLLTEEDVYREKLIAIADNIVSRLTSTIDNYEIGFVEKFNNDWSWDDNTANDNTRTIMGHVLKAGWVLGRIHQVIPNEIYVEAAEKLVMNVYEKGYDHVHGAPFKDYDRVTGQMYFYGQDTAKAWWQVEQAIVAGLELYDITNDDIYLKMADESLDFFMRYFVDHTYGDIYADLFSDGSLIPSWGTQKGNDWKAAYHSIETGYYAYIYGNIFYNNNPIELYYKIDPVNYDREIKLAPLAVNTNLRIKHVELENVQYSKYAADESKLYVDADSGGKFKVTFESIIPVAVNESESLILNYELSQNYPNPFNPSTSIEFTIPNESYVTLKVYDVQGQEVSSLINENLRAGIYKKTFDASGLASGMYFYVLSSSDISISKKMIILK
jgi:mannose/cellobiose epimerase-like protein (N-acyl-D-glucosamine 2-epimerase family)